MARYGSGDDETVITEYLEAHLEGGIKQKNLDFVLDLIDEYVELKESVLEGEDNNDKGNIKKSNWNQKWYWFFEKANNISRSIKKYIWKLERMEFKSSCEIRKGIGRVIKISMSMNFPFYLDKEGEILYERYYDCKNR